MSNQELLQQFLAVASRASQQGKQIEQIVGIMELAKAAVVARAVTFISQPTSGIIPASGLPTGIPSLEEIRNQPPGTLGRG